MANDFAKLRTTLIQVLLVRQYAVFFFLISSILSNHNIKITKSIWKSWITWFLRSGKLKIAKCQLKNPRNEQRTASKFVGSAWCSRSLTIRKNFFFVSQTLCFFIQNVSLSSSNGTKLRNQSHASVFEFLSFNCWFVWIWRYPQSFSLIASVQFYVISLYYHCNDR